MHKCLLCNGIQDMAHFNIATRYFWMQSMLRVFSLFKKKTDEGKKAILKAIYNKQYLSSFGLWMSFLGQEKIQNKLIKAHSNYFFYLLYESLNENITETYRWWYLHRFEEFLHKMSQISVLRGFCAKDEISIIVVCLLK